MQISCHSRGLAPARLTRAAYALPLGYCQYRFYQALRGRAPLASLHGPARGHLAKGCNGFGRKRGLLWTAPWLRGTALSWLTPGPDPARRARLRLLRNREAKP